MHYFLVMLKVSSIKSFNILQVTVKKILFFSKTDIPGSVCLLESCINCITKHLEGTFFTAFEVCGEILCILCRCDGRETSRNDNGALTLAIKLALLELILMYYSLSL